MCNHFLKVNCFIHRLKVLRSGALLVSSDRAFQVEIDRYWKVLSSKVVVTLSTLGTMKKRISIFCWLIKSSMVFWWYLFQFLFQKLPDPQDNKTRRRMFVFFIHHWNLGKVSIFLVFSGSFAVRSDNIFYRCLAANFEFAGFA